jgi:hypothetical protein
MTRLFLGLLVVSMLVLAGGVLFQSFHGPDVPLPTDPTVTVSETSCCTEGVKTVTTSPDCCDDPPVKSAADIKKH